MVNLSETYEPRIAGSRQLVARAGVLGRMLAPDVKPIVLERFLIEYCSFGVQITEPVEGWIDRAGRRCVEIGLEDIGKSLSSHAAHESGHHLMFIEDTRRLVSRWNARRPWQLDAHRLIKRPKTSAMEHYVALHEDTIRGAMPFGQVAIELEIERLSVVLVPKLLEQVKRALGDDAVSSLTFLSSHGELDVGHTHLNTRMMENLLRLRPDAAPDMARIGAEALFTYLAFFDECWEAARRDCERFEGATA